MSCLTLLDQNHNIVLSVVEDWDVFEKMLDYVYGHYVKSDPDLHPVLMSEASVSIVFWNCH